MTIDATELLGLYFKETTLDFDSHEKQLLRGFAEWLDARTRRAEVDVRPVAPWENPGYRPYMTLGEPARMKLEKDYERELDQWRLRNPGMR